MRIKLGWSFWFMRQVRLSVQTTPFYDMSYQTPTTLAAVRDAAALGNVGYSISDGRFTRTDNNASPVPSTLSQQTSTLTQGHQAQPILAAGTAAPYFFATAFNTIPPNYQFGAMYTVRLRFRLRFFGYFCTMWESKFKKRNINEIPL